MALRARMDLLAEQQMLLLPRMLQSIEVLQLAGADLDAWLAEAAEGNEALALGEPVDRPGRRGTWADADAHAAMLENQPGRGATVAERVVEQLATAALPPEREAWVRFLIGCLDERGYLSLDDADLLALARRAGLEGDEGTLGEAIAALQGLEPRGIGARDAIEALLLQLDPADPDYPPLCRLLEEHVEDLAHNRLPRVARAMDVDLSELRRLIAVLAELNPRPGSVYADESAPTLRPEVLVEWTGEEFEVRLAQGGVPAVGLDPEVSRLASDRAQAAEVRRYLRGKIGQARWIIEAIEQRSRTLLRVAQAVLGHQRAFLREGPGHLAPLSMTRVAEELGLHVSTVSRAVAGKTVQTPWGVLPLRDFFQSAAGGGEGEGAARADVRELVRAVVDDEDPAQPLSDGDLALELRRRGFAVARRTVAKYRKELGIPSSYLRRRHSA